MGVYNRDNINYGAAISQAIRNAERSGEIRADRIRKMGDIWAGAVKNVGDTASRAFGSAAMFSGSSASQQLAAAQAERQMLIDQEAQEAATKAAGQSPEVGMVGAQNQMVGYHPNVPEDRRVVQFGEVKNPSVTNPYATPMNPNATQDEYFRYAMAMNTLFGGR